MPVSRNPVNKEVTWNLQAGHSAVSKEILKNILGPRQDCPQSLFCTEVTRTIYYEDTFNKWVQTEKGMSVACVCKKQSHKRENHYFTHCIYPAASHDGSTHLLCKHTRRHTLYKICQTCHFAIALGMKV